MVTNYPKLLPFLVFFYYFYYYYYISKILAYFYKNSSKEKARLCDPLLPELNTVRVFFVHPYYMWVGVSDFVLLNT